MSELLIVDDDRIVREQLKLLFESEGYVVRIASNGEKAITEFLETKPDLVLMDVMMPRMNGYAAAKRLHEIDNKVPIIFLTAKDSDADEMYAFSVGAHDFISKSVEGCLLVARVRRALERTIEISGDDDSDQVNIGELKVDFSLGTVHSKEKNVEYLTKTELDLLKLLYDAHGAYLSMNSIISSLRGLGFACIDTMLYVHICNLRKKLGANGVKIICERKQGYKLEYN